MLVFRAHGHQLPPNEITEIALQLKKGAVCIFPTDSVYTMACAFSSNKGIEIGKAICRQLKLVAHTADHDTSLQSEELQWG